MVYSRVHQFHYHRLPNGGILHLSKECHCEGLAHSQSRSPIALQIHVG